MTQFTTQELDNIRSLVTKHVSALSRAKLTVPLPSPKPPVVNREKVRGPRKGGSLFEIDGDPNPHTQRPEFSGTPNGSVQRGSHNEDSPYRVTANSDWEDDFGGDDLGQGDPNHPCWKCDSPMEWIGDARNPSGADGAWYCTNEMCGGVDANNPPSPEVKPSLYSPGDKVKINDPSHFLHGQEADVLTPSYDLNGQTVHNLGIGPTPEGTWDAYGYASPQQMEPVEFPQHPDPWMDNEPGTLTYPQHWGSKQSGWGDNDEITNWDMNQMYGPNRDKGPAPIPRILYHGTDQVLDDIDQNGLLMDPPRRNYPAFDQGVYVTDNANDAAAWGRSLYAIDRAKLAPGTQIERDNSNDAHGAYRILGDVPPHALALHHPDTLDGDMDWAPQYEVPPLPVDTTKNRVAGAARGRIAAMSRRQANFGWDEWQQGLCGTYACALMQEYPHLRFGQLGSADAGTHYFAHDDTHAYDSLGRHPLPYLGIDNQWLPEDAELDSDPEWYGLPQDESGPEGPEPNLQRALEHIRTTKPLERDYQ